MSRIEPRKERHSRTPEPEAAARLQNSVTFGAASDTRVVRRAIEGVRDDADQLTRCASWKPRVAVKRDAVPDIGQHRQVADAHGEARVGGAAQQPIEFFDLP